jgi:beta-lactamase superfamily II metal-dependent hydrolase
MRSRIIPALNIVFAIAAFLLLCTAAFSQQGNLQIHFMDVGQGDAALLISPLGETVMFDDGTTGTCAKPVAYLTKLGITKIDYHIASHYHSDHIGCAAEIFGKFPLSKTAYDRGGNYNSKVYKTYLSMIGLKRKLAAEGTIITLDASSSNPVTIKIVALNGNGTPTTNENDLSVVAVVKYGNFDAVMGGDLSGFKTGSYEDIETSVAPKVGQVEVYKVNHHCSQYSSNSIWLDTLQPKIAVISVGDGNSYGHPTEECLERLHNSGIKTFWTEKGIGTPDSEMDVLAGNVIVEVVPNTQGFKVSYGTGKVEQFPFWEGGENPLLTYAWSKNSNIYHYSNCPTVKTIKAENLVQGATPPEGKTLHQNCQK